MIDLLVKTFVKGSDRVQDPAVRQRYGALSGGVGIFLNLFLFAFKLLAGLVTASIAITADALNNLTDAASSVVTLIGFRLAGQEADEEHPFGHGRMEYLAGLVVSLLILLVGVELAKTSFDKILHPEPVDFSVLSAVILAAAVAVKLWMFFFNRRLSGRIGSAALAATAADSLSDAVATGVLLLGLLAGHFFQLPLDGWLGLGVACFILRAGWGAAKDTVDPLLGQSPDPQLVKDIEAAVMAHPQIAGIHDLVIHDYGPGRRMMCLHAEIPADGDLLEAHDHIDAIERELKDRFGILACIHMDPIATSDPHTLALRARMADLVREIDPAMTIHDFRITAGPRHTNLIFDVVVPHGCKLDDSAVRAAVAEKAAALEGNYYVVLQIDRVYV